MLISILPTFRQTQIQRSLFVAVGTCAILLAVPSNAGLEIEATGNTVKLQRIKRLKLADPESTETMLADCGLDLRNRSQFPS